MPAKPENPAILTTLLVPVPEDTVCLWPPCGRLIRKGEKAIQSPSAAGFYYDLECFKDFVRSKGKDPDKFIRIVSSDKSKNN